MSADEVVITGAGVVCPIGTGKDQFWDSMLAGRSGVGEFRGFSHAGMPVKIAAEVDDFNPKSFVKQRKSLKVMSRDGQLCVAASVMARADAGIDEGAVDPERFGVVLGGDQISNVMAGTELPYRACMVDREFCYDRWGTEGMRATFPLSFLSVLPNMTASHVSIAHDARGPNNTVHQSAVSSLLAVIEAATVIERGMADVMIAGGASSRMKPGDWTAHCMIGRLSTSRDKPETVLRPFDAKRSGDVRGEGSAAFILESRRHAEARNAPILAKLLGWGRVWKPAAGSELQGTGIERAISGAVQTAGIRPEDLGHLNAQGASTIEDDPVEAQAIHRCLPDVPVTAPKSYFGYLGAASGAVEMLASVSALDHGLVPPTLNYEHADPACPVRVIQTEPMASKKSTALVLNWTRVGQAVALVLAAP